MNTNENELIELTITNTFGTDGTGKSGNMDVIRGYIDGSAEYAPGFLPFYRVSTSGLIYVRTDCISNWRLLTKDLNKRRNQQALLSLAMVEESNKARGLSYYTGKDLFTTVAIPMAAKLLLDIDRKDLADKIAPDVLDAIYEECRKLQTEKK